MKKGDLIHHVTGRRHTYMAEAMCKHMGCYTVVKKERFEEQWPEDPEFKAFADLLANSVQKALFEGWTIMVAPCCSFEDKRCCPLGALPSSQEAGIDTPVLGITEFPGEDGWVFANAFDNGEGDTSNPYVRLALAYRKRFVKEKGE